MQKKVGSSGRNYTKQDGVEGNLKKAPKVLVGSCEAERAPRSIAYQLTSLGVWIRGKEVEDTKKGKKHIED